MATGSFRISRLPPGGVLGDAYRIVRWLGQGSMGAVYEAEPKDGGERVAIKVMDVKLLEDRRARRRFEREGELGTRIPSESVVHTLASGFDAEQEAYFIVMEYVDGQRLDVWRTGSGVSAGEIRSVIQQLLRAVAAAHAAGVVHRDLKPANVIVETATADAAGPRVKVLDFGVAKWLHSTTGASTQAGLGTPTWTAPEQGKAGHRVDPNADVWALGLMVFWLLTGKQYWLSAGEDGGLADLVLELVRRPIVPASERAKALGTGDALPPRFDAWFARCVCRDPAARFADAGQALDALAPVLGLEARSSRWFSRWRRRAGRRATDPDPVSR